MKEVVHIEDWSIGAFDTDPYKAPECRSKILAGHVSNHPTMGNSRVATSPIVKFAIPEGKVETLNTIYELGAPKPDYIQYSLKHASKSAINELLVGGFITEEQALPRLWEDEDKT